MTPPKETLSDHDKGLLKSIDDQYNWAFEILGTDPLIYYRFSVLPPVDEDIRESQEDLTNKRQVAFGKVPVRSKGQ
jgi:hypothetical protein